jgi:hypothetical protein
MKVIKNKKGNKQRLLSLDEARNVSCFLYQLWLNDRHREGQFSNFQKEQKDFRKFAIYLCARTNQYLRKDFRRRSNPTMTKILKEINKRTKQFTTTELNG